MAASDASDRVFYHLQVLGLANALLPSVPDATAAAMADPPVCTLDATFSNNNIAQKDDDNVRIATLNSNPGIMETYSTDLMDQLLMVRRMLCAICLAILLL